MSDRAVTAAGRLHTENEQLRDRLAALERELAEARALWEAEHATVMRIGEERAAARAEVSMLRSQLRAAEDRADMREAEGKAEVERKLAEARASIARWEAKEVHEAMKCWQDNT